MGGRVIVVTSAADWDKYSKTGTVVVNFGAAWCGPCKQFAPVYESVSNDYNDFTFLYVDIDGQPEISRLCGIKSVPSCVVLVTGRKVDGVTGLISSSGLRAMLDKYKQAAAT